MDCGSCSGGLSTEPTVGVHCEQDTTHGESGLILRDMCVIIAGYDKVPINEFCSECHDIEKNRVKMG